MDSSTPDIERWRGFWPGSERYFFDFNICTHENGWVQYDTDQDASYFGIWVHMKERAICTYAEGDLYLVVHASEDSFRGGLKELADFHGDPPPAFVVIDGNTGSVTEIFTERPGSD